MLRRRDYLRALRGFLGRVHTLETSRLWTEPGNPEEWFRAGAVSHLLANAFAVLWRFDKREDDLRTAKDLLLRFTTTAPWACSAAAGAYRILRSHLTRREREEFGRRWAEQAVEPLERFCAQRLPNLKYGNNHKIGACAYADLVRKLFPRVAAPYRFERLTDPVWRDMWERRDFQEEAVDYEGATEQLLCVWARERGMEKAFYRSPSIINMFERNRLIVTPSGLVAAYGDSGHPPRPSVWMALLELVARKTRDGRFRQCAEDIFRRCQRTEHWRRLGPLEKLTRMPRYVARHVLRGFALDCASLADAAVACDERIRPRPRPLAGRIRRLPRNAALKPSEREGGTIADERFVTQQVALVGGPDPKTYVLLSVGRPLAHDHADAGAIQLLAKGDAELLGTNGYLMRPLYFHNTFFAQESSRPRFPDDRRKVGFFGSAACAPEEVEVDAHSDHGYCRMVFQSYHELPASLVREVTVHRTGEVMLVDRLAVREGRLRAGLLFHAESLRRAGGRAFALRLGLLRAMDGAELPNAPGRLRAEFAVGDGEFAVRSLERPDIFETNPAYQQFPCSGYKKLWARSYTAKKCLTYSRPVAAGEEAVWVTVLRPESSA